MPNFDNKMAMDGKSRISPITAINIIMELNIPKWPVGTNLLNIITPNPMDRIRDESRIALPLILMVPLSAF